MMKIFTIAKVNLLDIFRDLRSNAITFVLPAIFILIFGFLFSQTHEISAWKIGVVKDENLVKTLEEVNEKSQEPLFNITTFTEKEEALDSLKARDVETVVEISETGQIIITIDETNQRSSIASTIVRDVFAPVQDEHISYKSVIGRENISGFELMAAGLIIYGILIIIPQVAGTIARLNEKRYLLRYATSKTTAFEILSGFTISHFLLGIIQTLLLLYITTWFGLEINSYTLQAFIFVIPVIFFSIGVGLLLGSFFEKGEAGQNLGTMFSVVLGFLSGSFIIGIENIGTEIGDRFVAITDFVPTFYAYRGMTDLIVFNSDFSQVVSNLIVISTSSIIIFILGIYFYNKKNLKIG